MRTIGGKIVKPTFTFSTSKKTQIHYFLIFFFENEFLKDVKIYEKKKKKQV